MKTLIFILSLVTLSFNLWSQETTKRVSLLYHGAATNGSEVELSQIIHDTVIVFRFDDSEIDERYEITGGFIKVETIPGTGLIKEGGYLDEYSKKIISMSEGKVVNVHISYIKDGRVKGKMGIVYSVK